MSPTSGGTGVNDEQSPQGRYASVEGTRTYYETSGPADGPPVVLVHTAGADGRQWRHLAPQLAEAGYRAIAVDLPGHGKSYPVDWEPRTTIHQYARFVHAVTDVLGLDRPIVGGCSIGGAIALDIAVNYADEVSCVVSMAATGRTRGAPLGRLEHPHACPGWQDILEYSVVDATAEATSPACRTELRWQHRGSQRVATNDLQAWADHDVSASLPDATCPVLLLRGEADYFIQDDYYERTVAGLPECEAHVLADVGHYPMMEAPDRVSELMIAFLREHHKR